MPISVEDALMRDAVARLEQAAHVNPKWIWDAKKVRAVLRSSGGRAAAVIFVRPWWIAGTELVGFTRSTDTSVTYWTPQSAMEVVERLSAAPEVETTINGEEKP